MMCQDVNVEGLEAYQEIDIADYLRCSFLLK